MPFYEYECSSCKYAAEVLQKISDTPLKKCPSCGKGTFKRLISAPVFRLKGSGWYETDFKSDKESKRNLAGAEREDSKPAADAAAAAPAKGETAAESKPAAKPEGAAAAKAPAPAPAQAPRARRTPAKRPAAKRPTARSRGGRRGSR
jgi:putative FmdB family regulatory protein